MEAQQNNALQNFDDPKTEILEKILLNATNTNIVGNISRNGSQHNVLLNTLRAPTSSSMIVSPVQAPQSSLPITHNLVTHSIAPVKIHTNNSPYPLQLSTVHVPVQIPGSTSNINVPVQLPTATSTMPLQINPVSLPLQVSGTTNIPVHLPAGDTINVPLQLPPVSQNIQLTGQTLPSMPLLQNPPPLHSSIIHVHVGSNTRPSNIDANSEMNVSGSSQLQIPESTGVGVQVKMNNTSSISQMQVASNSTVVQTSNSANNAIQLALPGTGGSGSVQLRAQQRNVPHVVYIQTPTGLKPVTSTEVISQASTSGNPPQIIVRRPVPSNSNIHLISNMNKPNIAKMPKPQTKNKSILAPANASQPIVIQKPKPSDKMMVPVTIAPMAQTKQAIAYLGSMKKANTKCVIEKQSILISSNQQTMNPHNPKLFLTPMTMPKKQNTKFIMPVTLPGTMASKGPIINLQIANGQIQNDPQGNIKVMRDASPVEAADVPLLQPLTKLTNVNSNKDVLNSQSSKNEKSFTMTIPGSIAEPTGEQGEYTLSIPETNSSMNDDIYTVSIEDEENGQTLEKSFTLAIPEKSKCLLNKNIVDRDMAPITVPAPAILRRSYSDNGERKISNVNLKRRISLCNENLDNKSGKSTPQQTKENHIVSHIDLDTNDDHRVPSLFCDEKLDKDLDLKTNIDDSDQEEDKDKIKLIPEASIDVLYQNLEQCSRNSSKRKDSSESILEEDPPGLIWNNGVAHLQGSELQFQTNEFGLIDLVDGHESGNLKMNQNNLTQLKHRNENKYKEKKSKSPEDLFSCEGCGCHGMAADFVTQNFCSLACQTKVQKKNQRKRDKEKAELMRKKNKVKKFLMKKQTSESEAVQEIKDGQDSPNHNNSGDGQLVEATLLKMSEDLIEDEKYPWMCGKNGFSWMRYLDNCKAKAAPVKLFKDPFPSNRNGFKVGMRLEAIDPQHPALFCVVTVMEVQGYRMRLHFDEYPALYDFWVNADSVDIFPAGWCERNGRALTPPSAYTPDTFYWPMYLKKTRSVAAPKHLFPHITTLTAKPNGFRIGMKLEAEDVENDMVCVASVADMREHRLLISFDNWDRSYDYWADPTSPYIHPVGWAKENGYTLTPPNGYKDTDTFSWQAYLEETGASAAPARAFRPRAPLAFKPAMKLEVVDPRVPFLIRVATISEVKGHQVRVTFDGWPEELSCWLDDDSPDMHPVGWCLKTGHPLEPPLTAEDQQVKGPCGVGGCRGLGSVRGGGYKQHAAASTCPYRGAPLELPDRLPKIPVKSHKEQAQRAVPSSDASKEKLPRGRPPKHKQQVEAEKNGHDVSDDESLSSCTGSKRWRRGTDASVGRGEGAVAVRDKASPQHFSRVLLAAHVAELGLPSDPVSWTQSEVAALVSRVAGVAAGAASEDAQLSGAELLMASCEELVACLRLRLGPAIKVYAAVRQLRDSLT